MKRYLFFVTIAFLLFSILTSCSVTPKSFSDEERATVVFDSLADLENYVKNGRAGKYQKELATYFDNSILRQGYLSPSELFGKEPSAGECSIINLWAPFLDLDYVCDLPADAYNVYAYRFVYHYDHTVVTVGRTYWNDLYESSVEQYAQVTEKDGVKTLLYGEDGKQTFRVQSANFIVTVTTKDGCPAVFEPFRTGEGEAFDRALEKIVAAIEAHSAVNADAIKTGASKEEFCSLCFGGAVLFADCGVVTTADHQTVLVIFDEHEKIRLIETFPLPEDVGKALDSVKEGDSITEVIEASGAPYRVDFRDSHKILYPLPEGFACLIEFDRAGNVIFKTTTYDALAPVPHAYP